MKRWILAGALALLMALLLACGGDDDEGTASQTSAPTQAPTTAAAAAPTQAPAPTEAMAMSQSLEDYAAKMAGGPGAIYVGDLNQLVGTAPGNGDLGAENNQVPLDMLQKHSYLVESDYYKALLEKAKLTNPTPLTSEGENFNIQYACINRALQPCILSIVYFAPNVLERTNGQVDFEIISYPELGIAGPDMMDLISNGTISFGQVQPAYVGGTMPLIDIIYIWGLWKDHQSEHAANTALLPALDAQVSEQSGGAEVIYHIWYAGNDQYFFSNRRYDKPGDFDGMKTRSHGTTMTDFINGLGGEGQFVAFAEVYTALERGILEAGVTGADAGWGQRWYEVTDYLVGPALSTPMGFETMNKDVWNSMPTDLQQIVIEEGAKMELENLRLGGVWNETGLQKNIRDGMELIEWTDEQKETIRQDVTLGRVLPNWIKRVEDSDIALFNQIVGPLAGVRIESDRSVTATE